MGFYQPDGWKFVKLTNNDGESHYRVAAGWSGGYLDSDWWKINSGIVSIVVNEDGGWDITGDSGSIYRIGDQNEDQTMAITMAYDYLDRAVNDGHLISWERVDRKEVFDQFLQSDG